MAGPRATFTEACFLSVQTLGSIGYGVHHPLGLAANLIVTAESLTGLLFVAISTGLAFARFARSNARIRCSELAVIPPYNGVPTLSFRLVNEQGNLIREARFKAFLAVDEISGEGHRLRPLMARAVRSASSPQLSAGTGSDHAGGFRGPAKTPVPRVPPESRPSSLVAARLPR